MVKFTIVKTTTVEVMVIYKTKMFKNSFKKMPINDAALIDIANEVYAGHFEADLGGGIIKKRICIHGKGKSSGIRTIIFYKQGSNLFFADGWKKSHLSAKKSKEITDDELESYKDLAKDLFSATKNKIDKMVALGLLTEVKHD
ncbi:type II toxin-antitoxin system RelE/ParE family toxin [Proteus terrae]|uniref:type II toxin-antitoxin system RelE/ParE family toxin n=1 Tax=Proteus terrae TaxID=1574161 RepID=UPI0034D6C24D